MTNLLVKYVGGRQQGVVTEVEHDKIDFNKDNNFMRVVSERVYQKLIRSFPKGFEIMDIIHDVSGLVGKTADVVAMVDKKDAAVAATVSTIAKSVESITEEYDIKEYKCDKCSEVFGDRLAYARHKRTCK